MTGPRTRRRHGVLLTALAATALATAGCGGGTASDAGRHAPSKPAAHRSAPAGRDGGTSPAAELVPSRGPRAADWPDKAVTVDKAPRTGKIAPIADGYTGAAFLKRLAAAWHFTFTRPTEVEVAGGGTARHRQGSVSAGGRETLSVAATLSDSGDLESLSCMAYGDVPRAQEFLRACARLDHPEADQKATTDWLTSAKGQVDRVYAKSHMSSVGPLHLSGGAALQLWESQGADPKQKGPTYWLRVFGGGVAEH